jgi:hypothetical protein
MSILKVLPRKGTPLDLHKHLIDKANNIDHRNNKNIAVDMVNACIQHCAHYGKKVDEIRLAPKYYKLFSDAIYEILEKKHGRTDIDLTHGIEFKGLRVIKGSELMIKPLEYDLANIKASTAQA